MRFIKWLYPGMKVKRWVVLAFIGTILLGVGIAVLTNLAVLGLIEEMITYVTKIIFSKIFGTYATILAGIIIIITGLLFTIVGVRQTINTIIATLSPHNEDHIVELIYKKRNLKRGPKIVVIGGGTGLSVLLRGLKDYTSNITAIVTVADDGGSSGRLRDEYGILPPGDIRNCLVALADTENLMEELFQHRFSSGTLAGHSLGNLLLTAMTEITGDFESAIKATSKVLAIRGQVLPSTLTDVCLYAELVDGRIIAGESNISKSDIRINKVSLKPDECCPVSEALSAIEEADGIILGPGSLYTSVIPNLLVKDLAKAIKGSRAPKIYACNIMTQPGETDDYSAADHIQGIIDHAGSGIIDYAIINTQEIPRKMQKKYRSQGAIPVKANIKEIEKLGVKVVPENLVFETDLVRHHPHKLAKAIITLVLRLKNTEDRLKLVDFYLFNDQLKH